MKPIWIAILLLAAASLPTGILHLRLDCDATWALGLLAAGSSGTSGLLALGWAVVGRMEAASRLVLVALGLTTLAWSAVQLLFVGLSAFC
jgi:hypothetical protein